MLTRSALPYTYAPPKGSFSRVPKVSHAIHVEGQYTSSAIGGHRFKQQTSGIQRTIQPTGIAIAITDGTLDQLLKLGLPSFQNC